MGTLPRSLIVGIATLAAAAPCASAGEWLAGDVHTTYSHDVYGGLTDDNTGPTDANTFGFTVPAEFALAASRQLDFLAITDHNDIRSQGDFASAAAYGVIPVAGYENSLHGHAQMLGARKLYPAVDAGSATAVAGIADALRSDGGVFQVNHPANSTTEDPDDLDWALGYAVQPDTVEAWNSSHLYQPTFPAANSGDDAVRYWEGWLDRGAHTTLTGGSDSHWVATAAAQGAGQPTTWVYAHDRSQGAILEGLRRGHTMVSHQPPGYRGPRVFLEADADHDGTYEAMVGDTVKRKATVRVRVENAPGMRLRLIGDRGRVLYTPRTVTAANWSATFAIPKGATWLRAEVDQDDHPEVRAAHCPHPAVYGYCRNRLLVLAMASALYVER